MIIILFVALIISVVVATLSYKFIELPFIALGKRLIGKPKLQTESTL